MTSIFSHAPLAAIFAQEVDQTPNPFGQSERPKQTVVPLAAHLQPTGVEFILKTKKQLPDLLAEIHSPRYHNKSVIVSWAHQQLPELVEALGVPRAKVPHNWPGTRFDVTWVVSPGETVELSQFAQRLLYGDLDSVLDPGGIGHPAQSVGSLQED